MLSQTGSSSSSPTSEKGQLRSGQNKSPKKSVDLLFDEVNKIRAELAENKSYLFLGFYILLVMVAGMIVALAVLNLQTADTNAQRLNAIEQQINSQNQATISKPAVH